MPPKKAAGPSKKTVEKAKARTVEDKTFGLKNKSKSAKVQKFVKEVEQQVALSGKTKAQLKQEAEGPKKSKAQIEQERKEELAKLFNIAQPKVAEGVDPKSVLCELHRQGVCTKGDKCKYSHDMNVGRKGAKIDVYTDQRTIDGAKEQDELYSDMTKLEDAIEKRHGAHNKKMPPTEIVCKYFLDAVEQHKYGWFWECPNGNDKCHYRHCLPAGFVLKSKAKADEYQDEEEKISMEEEIEQLRLQITTRTPVTLDTFLAWKKRKTEEKNQKEAQAAEQRKTDIKSGKSKMSGREMFSFNPDLFVDDDAAADDEDYEIEQDPDVQELVIDVSGTSISLSAAAASSGEAASTAAAAAATAADTVGDIDEDLFGGDEEDGGEDE